MVQLKIRIARVPAGEYVTPGDIGTASQARAGHDWRFVVADGSATFIRDRVFRRAIGRGDIIVLH